MRIDSNVTLLPEIMEGNGYNTFASVAISFLSHPSGLDRGFKKISDYRDPDYKKKEPGFAGARASGITNSFIGWMKNENPEKFFAWLHYYDPHTFYTPPKEFNKFTSGDPFLLWKEIQKKRNRSLQILIIT